METMETITSGDLAHSNISILNDNLQIDTSLTFRYFLDFLKKKSAENRLYESFFSFVVKKFEEIPGLTARSVDLDLLRKHPKILKLLEATFFPPAEEESQHMFAFSTPWVFMPFHSSKKFDEVLYHNIVLADKQALQRFRREKTEKLFAVVLERLYNIKIDVNEEKIFPVVDPVTNLTRYYQVDYDLRFCDIIAKGELPDINTDNIETTFTSILASDGFCQLLSENFSMEGFTLLKVSDVTESAAIAELKNLLLRMLDEEVNIFPETELLIQSLLDLPSVHVCLVPFMKINNQPYLWTELKKGCVVNRVLKNDSEGKLLNEMEEYFAKHPYPILYPVVSSGKHLSFLEPLSESHVKSYFLSPLFRGKKLIGLLEIASTQPDTLQRTHQFRLRQAHVLLVQMIANYLQRMHDTMEQLIKDHFTSLQHSVEWKFRKAAFEYCQQKYLTGTAQMGTLEFHHVFPAYAAVDIRNSSVKRSDAIRKDLIEQLELTGTLLKNLRRQNDLPVLQELEFRTSQSIDRVHGGVTIEVEASVSSFLDSEIRENLSSLGMSEPAMEKAIQEYLEKTDKVEGSCCLNRRFYERSVTAINQALSQYLEKEDEKLQKFYPHLFEKYNTDGIEYNIYIGQSIQPAKPFQQIHKKNVYLWQLDTMIEMAKISARLQPSLKVKLETTQLIMLYGSPININFRKDERKFDVEDAYNIRYELMKKRIDKICVKGSSERLTQPGKIAIIYSRPKDVSVFDKYISYHVDSGNLSPNVEKLELEDTQGVSGLKALRVEVKL